MTKSKPVQTLVRLRSTTGRWLVHPDLRPRLIADADANGTNLNTVVTKILADRYKVPYEATGRRTAPVGESAILKADLPPRLATAVKYAAARAGRQWIDEIRLTLQAHYGLRPPVK